MSEQLDPEADSVAELNALRGEVARLRPVVEELAERSGIAMKEWGPDDKPTIRDNEIRAAHPTKTGRHSIYRSAFEFVTAKHSKFALVDLVNWLLVSVDDMKLERDAARAEVARLDRIAMDAVSTQEDTAIANSELEAELAALKEANATLRAERDAARAEVAHERAMANEWLAKAHDAGKEVEALKLRLDAESQRNDDRAVEVIEEREACIENVRDSDACDGCKRAIEADIMGAAKARGARK